jgi:hypothetical protein
MWARWRGPIFLRILLQPSGRVVVVFNTLIAFMLMEWACSGAG